MFLDDLWEDEGHLRFDALGEPHFSAYNESKPHDITWRATQPRKYIEYTHPQNRPLGSMMLNSWLLKRHKLYGPADDGDNMPFIV